MSQRNATCSCGQLQITCRGEPALVSRCHCIACQKRTGAPFGVAAFFHEADAVAGGQSVAFQRTSESGYALEFHFCPTCGSTVFWKPARKPGMVAVATGSFGDPGFPGPTQEVFLETRHDWVPGLAG